MWWRRPKFFGGSEEPERVQGEDRPVRASERHRLLRLLHRRAALLADLAQSEQALLPENRWVERLHELDAALADLESELVQLERPVVGMPRQTLPSLPLTIVVGKEAPATVELTIGPTRFRWREEVDWAERGHQLAPARLQLVLGDPAELAALAEEVDELLRQVLRASLDCLATDALAAARGERSWTPLTLADLAQPCPRCGGWRDLRGRCPSCVAREWERQQLIQARTRLRKERDEVYQDWQKARERLPVIRRQLAEVEADIAQLRARGVSLEGDSEIVVSE